MTQVPLEHLEYLAVQFSPEVEIDNYSQQEKDLLLKYGSWLKALMLGKIEPCTESQNLFLEMCNGKRHPETELEHLWKKYQLDLMYSIALQCEYHSGSRFSSEVTLLMFIRLAKQGHVAAMQKCNPSDVPNPHDPPLINIRLIYPENLDSADMYELLRLPGSFGSRQ